jgi:dTDP-D-glucose 4,6-dehydratase
MVKYTRDWLFVEDHAAIDLVFHKGVNMKPITLVVLMNGKILIW